MSLPLKIAPSVLSADFTRLGEEVQQATEAGAQRIHIDVMDGRFVPNITMGPLVVKAIRGGTELPLDVHLMIVEPERHLQAFADAGASILSVHLEASPHLHRTLQMIRELGMQPGVAINPHTPATALSEVMHLVDNIIVMTVNPGFGGQSFLAETLPKIRTLRQMSGQRKLNIDISADGGVDPNTATDILKAGANVLVAGSAVFGAEGGVVCGMAALNAVVAQYERSTYI
ncbi:MAG: ribulose-phosphate 3-epimerase [Chloroflexi bacterium]|nr:ribulose-phosphate 3-epimerase [Chloroflexota bacterium]